MITSQQNKTCIDVTVDADIAVACAAEARESLLAAIESTCPARIELSDSSPTAPALQLAIAARHSLQARGIFAGYGPRAALLLQE